MYVAKINKETSIVENTELADQEWLDNYTSDIYMYVPYTEEQPAVVGLKWSKKKGFEQVPEDSKTGNIVIGDEAPEHHDG